MIDENIKLIELFDKELGRKLSKLKDRVKEFKAKSGDPIFFYKIGTSEIWLNSKYNPKREAQVQTEDFSSENEHIVIIGGANGYYIEGIFEKIDGKKRILYVEPEISLFYGALKRINLKKYAEKFSFLTLTYLNDPLFSEKIASFVDIVALTKVDFAIHPITEKTFKEEVNTLKKRINDEILKIVYEFATRIRSGSSIQRQILKNIKHIVEESRLKELKEKFKGVPAIVVSAGPSLDKNIVYLKKAKERAVIIAVDTALKPLIESGVEPHFVVIGDPSYFNYLHLAFVETKDTYIIVEPSVEPKTFEKFKGGIFIANFNKPLLELIEKRIGDFGTIDVWGSVATGALSFAVYIDSSPIVIVGQDFSYSYGKSYSRKTYYEYGMVFHRDWNSYINSVKTRISEEIDSDNDIFGRETFTTKRLKAYRDHFIKIIKNNENNDFINSTEGGILKGIINKPFEEIVFTLKKIDFNIDYRIKEIYNSGKSTKKTSEVKKLLKELLKYFKEIKRISRNEVYLYNKKALLFDDIGRINDFIYSNLEFSEILENYSQEPIYTFLTAQKNLKDKGKLLEEYVRYVKKIEKIADEFLQILKESIENLDR